MTNLEKLYREVAKEKDISVEEATRICRYQFAFLVEEARQPIEQIGHVRFPLLCSFQPMDWAVTKLQKKREEIIDRNFQAFGHHAY
jgi:hypothetical protein